MLYEVITMKGLDQEYYDITFTKNKFHDPKHMSFSAHKHHHLEAMACEYEEKNVITSYSIHYTKLYE